MVVLLKLYIIIYINKKKKNISNFYIYNRLLLILINKIKSEFDYIYI